MLICKMIDVEVNDENHSIPLIAHIWKIVIIISFFWYVNRIFEKDKP